MHTFYVKTEYGGQGGEANLSGFEVSACRCRWLACPKCWLFASLLPGRTTAPHIVVSSPPLADPVFALLCCTGRGAPEGPGQGRHAHLLPVPGRSVPARPGKAVRASPGPQRGPPPCCRAPMMGVAVAAGQQGRGSAEGADGEDRGLLRHRWPGGPRPGEAGAGPAGLPPQDWQGGQAPLLRRAKASVTLASRPC